jgi:hypothetical protein
MQTTGSRKWGVIGVVVAFITIVIILGVVATYMFTMRGSEGPSVVITQPDAELVISAGQGLLVVAQASAAGQPITHCDLLVDGELTFQQVTQGSDARQVTVSFPWFSTKPGRHALSVVAYDNDNRPSAPAQVHVTVTGAEILSDYLSTEPSGPSGQSAPGGQPDGLAQAPANEWEVPLFDEALDQSVGLGEGGAQQSQALDENTRNILPPTISFDTSFARLGGVVEVHFATQAAGDTGLDRIEFIRTRRNDDLAIPFSKDCEESLACVHNDTFNISITETWVITAQAFDTAGQASEMKIEVIELAGDNFLGPAIIEEQFRAPVMNVDSEQADLGPVINLADAADAMLEEGGVQVPLGDPVDNLNDCLILSITPNAQGCSGLRCDSTIILDVTCDVFAPEGLDVILGMSGRLYATLGAPFSLTLPELNSSGRTSISAGSRFEIPSSGWCGSSYMYTAALSFGVYPPGANNPVRIVGRATETHAYPPCTPDTINANITLNAEDQPNNTLIRWQFNPAGDWSLQLPPDPVQVRLFRYLPELRAPTLLYDESIPGNQLPGSSGQAEGIRGWCGDPYYYTLTGTYQNIDIFRVTTVGPQRPCPVGSIADISVDLQASPSFHNRRGYITYRVDIPAGFSWPEGETIILELHRWGDTVPPERQFGIMLTEPVYQNGYIASGRDDGRGRIFCGLFEYRYFLILSVDAVVVDQSPIYTITTPPCP